MEKNEADQLISRIRDGDDEALEMLVEGLQPFVGSRCNSILAGRTIDPNYREDLMQAGNTGLMRAIKNYDPDDTASFTTYAKYYIDPEISKELANLIKTDNNSGIICHSSDKDKSAEELKAYEALSALRFGASKKGSALTAKERNAMLESMGISTDGNRFTSVSFVLQIMEILRSATDEKNPITIEQLKDALTMYRIVKYNSAFLESENTFSKNIDKILAEVDPLEYSRKNEAEYKIKYEGYKNNELKKKLENNEPGKHKITKLQYVQPFSYQDLDELIQTISFSLYLSQEDKDKLISKIFNAVGGYYQSPFWDGRHLMFNPSAIHGRFSKTSRNGENQITNNLKTIQTAINNLWQIKFTMNAYDADGDLVPTPRNPHYFSPFHIVVYQDLFYLIGLWSDGTNKKIYHYRIDLMSDVMILTDEHNKPCRIKMYGADDLPIWNYNWDPAKYLSEHLYMAYDDPRDIRIKIRNTDYTDICKWFNGYTKTNIPCEDGYDVIIVRTSPSMIVHWALQYSSKVEILDEDIRAEIRKELEKLGEKYGK